MDQPIQPSSVEQPTRTGLTQGTDLHQSKIPPGDPRLHIERPRSRTLRKGPILAITAVLGFALAAALVAALVGSTKDSAQKKDQDDRPGSAASPMPLPDIIADPGSAPGHTDGGAPHVHPGTGSSARVERTADRAKAVEDVREDDLLKARSSTLFAGNDDAPLVQQGAVEPPARPAEATPPTGSAATHPVESQRADDPNRQERKNDFLARAGVSGGEYLEKGLTLPRSPYEIKAGTVIPAVLITGINSDLPGAVVGQVRENVYDSVSGNYLLIPQGSRLIAAYDSMVAWGQERALLCWQRLIRPDGSSLTLDCMPGVDLAGYAGFADEVDNHWWRIIGGAALSSLLAATAQRSQGDVTGYQPSLSQSWAGGTAAGINQAGQQITEKNLQIQPTITVRPGFTVNVLVTKDIVIPPYPQPAVRR
jgi:type IV secretion system protein VirB10